jgi:exonuclease VII small subunit
MNLRNKINESARIEASKLSGEPAFKTNYVTIESRLKTFEHAIQLLDPNRLAEAGFFLVSRETSHNQPTTSVASAQTEQTEIEKIVSMLPALSLYHAKCAFCAYECLFLGNLLLNSHYTSPFDEHREKYGSICPTMSGVKAYTPAFTELQARLETFRKWPATLKQQPADLAKAGFFYFDRNDSVKCFFCNGILEKWDHNDCPYEEHARCLPKCHFIRQLMGDEYIEKIREKFKNEASGFNDDELDKATITSLPSSGSFSFEINSSRTCTSTAAAFGVLGWSKAEANLTDTFNSTTGTLKNASNTLKNASNTLNNAIKMFKNATEIYENPATLKKESNKLCKSLQQDNDRHKNERKCAMCLNKDKKVIFMPCAHLVSCLECSMPLDVCPVCLVQVQSKIKVFL